MIVSLPIATSLLASLAVAAPNIFRYRNAEPEAQPQLSGALPNNLLPFFLPNLNSPPIPLTDLFPGQDDSDSDSDSDSDTLNTTPPNILDTPNVSNLLNSDPSTTPDALDPSGLPDPTSDVLSSAPIPAISALPNMGSTSGGLLAGLASLGPVSPFTLFTCPANTVPYCCYSADQALGAATVGGFDLGLGLLNFCLNMCPTMSMLSQVQTECCTGCTGAANLTDCIMDPTRGFCQVGSVAGPAPSMGQLLPTLPVSLPSVSLPSVSLPSISGLSVLVSLPIPTISGLSVSGLSVPVPTLSGLSTSIPSLSVGVSSLSFPSISIQLPSASAASITLPALSLGL
ncbi:MAG: hypothetical protein M1834_003858 [Cirrosporium novae-zelandiae]|nr:MAG: hypothetical protein M1834_003858 [Cirrosporium novae-zelandiae]